ncbi:TRAP transporter small permease subunit [Ferrovibrio sp.]|uniref:TRAP transporter small permease n=1 Tax=Ferrovibrio sp. TaxID=1917215 RepID=UPI001B66FB59|nr:TRAP transporter small permease subunit [Ferrovibrio sp.]MBP7065976.1 TRAP transporter small permease [Ferrovibrio sp.]
MITRAVASICRFASALAGLAALVCLALVGIGVGARYFFHASQSWIDETATWLVVIMVMLAMPEAQRLNANIGVDALTLKFGLRGQRRLALFSAASVAVVGGLMLWAGIETVSFSQMIGVMANTLAWVPLWWVQIFLPIGGSLLLLVALVQFGAALRSDWQPPASDDPVHGTRSHE